MPLVEGKYVAPDWQNEGPPAIDAEELNAISQTLVNTYTKEEININHSVPIGSVFWLASQNIPDGYLLCDGSAISRTDYAALFAVIGTTFGTGNGSTTFALPDLRAAFIRGAGSNGIFNASFGQKQGASGIGIPNRSPYERYVNTENNVRTVSGSDYFSTIASTTVQQTTVQRTEYFFRPYNLVLTPIIKY